MSIPRQGWEVLRWGPPEVGRWRTGSSLAGGWRSTNRRLLDWSLRTDWPFFILLNGTLWVNNNWLFLFFKSNFFFFFLDLDDFDRLLRRHNRKLFKILGLPYFLGFEIGFFLYEEYFSCIFRFFINVDNIISEIYIIDAGSNLLTRLWTPRLPLLCLLFFLLVLGQYFRTQINSPGIDHGSPLVIRYHWSDGLQAAEARYDQTGHCCRRWHQHLATESVARRRLRRLLQRFSINAAQTLTLNGPSLLGRESLQRCLVRLEINR